MSDRKNYRQAAVRWLRENGFVEPNAEGEQLENGVWVLRGIPEGHLWLPPEIKSTFAMNHKAHRWVTGINSDRYADYCEADDIHDGPLWLSFLNLGGQPKGCEEDSPGGFYCGYVPLLRRNIFQRWEGKDREGNLVCMVYWTINYLQRRAPLAEILPEK
jgi:hypothetical protein